MTVVARLRMPLPLTGLQRVVKDLGTLYGPGLRALPMKDGDEFLEIAKVDE